MHQSVKLFFLGRIGFIFPVILSLVLVIYKYEELLFPGDLIINILTATILILFFNLYGNNIIGLIMEISSLFLFNLMIFIKSFHVYLYENFFSETSFYVLMETNIMEAESYFSTYLDLPLIISTTLLTLIMLFSAILIVRDYNKVGGPFLLAKRKSLFFGLKVNYKLILLSVFVIFLAYSKFNSTRPFYFLPFTLSKGYIHYKKDLAAYQKLGNDKYGGSFTNVKNSEEDEIYVLVIGESTSRNHMGLYGYYRPTNPLLTELKDELLVYNDIISPNATTIASLSKVLTLGNHENPDDRFKGSIIQLFNTAGFKTYWISSQKTSGINATFVTGISNSCDEQYFISAYGKQPLDEELFNPLDKVLSDGAGKKLIILHLLGTHASYKKRYPKNFEHFTDKPRSIFKHQKAHYYINKYDNAILYNDFVISEIIKKLKRYPFNSSLVYFSDHGEEVYTSMNLTGHWEDNNSKVMYDIPFLIWFSSDEFKRSKNLIFDVNRKYSTENLIYTLSELASIEFEEFDSTKSLFHSDFKFNRRMISKNISYDESFVSN